MPRRFALLALICAWTLPAQEYRSTITGHITDPSGSAVPNVKVTVIKPDTNIRSVTASSQDGFFTIPQLPPGTYDVTAEANGFKTFVQRGIELSSNVRAAVDIQLSIGTAGESVTVVGDVPALNTASASTGQSITAREVENLPINGRAPMDLAVMAYGVVNTGVRDQNRPYENSGFSNLSMGGAAAGANEVLLDGVPNLGTLGNATTQNDRRAAFSPPVDAVSEVKVDVLNVDAAYGGSGGGTVQVITKSGTNDFHGALSEFNQVSNLTATPFFTNAAGGHKTNFRQNQWGLAVGGPVWLPKIYNGKDKLFWFFTYEGHTNSEPAPTYTTVPTEAERNGDFSALTKINTSYALYDPNTAVLANGVVTRQAFGGNIIPATRINPIATKYLSYIGQPNFQGKADGTNNFFTGLTTNNTYSAYSGRMDAYLSNANRITFSGRESDWIQKSGNIFNDIALGENGLRGIWGGMIDDVHTFSPTTVGNLRAGFTRYRAFYEQNSFGYDPTQLGFPSYVAGNATKLLMPQFAFSDGFLIASPVTNLHMSDQPYNIYQLFGSLTHIAGRHTLKAGGEYRVLDFSNYAWAGSTGNYTFDNSWIKANTNAAGPALGGSMAAFLLGLPSSGNYTINAASKSDSKYEVLFLQDDWHLRPNLTINAGLRWEYNSPTTERWNRQVTGFDPAADNSTTAAARAAYAKSPVALLPSAQFNPAGGLLFASADHRNPTNTTKTAFSPRFGISWMPSALKNRTAIRVGAGMFDYVYGAITPQQSGFTQTTTYVATNNSFVSPATTLSNPFPSGISRPVGASQGINTFLGQSVTFLNSELARQYSLRWTLDIQHQIDKNTLFEIGYIGNHSVHLATNYNFGSLPAQYLSRSLTRDNATISALGAVVANPFAGLLPGTSLNGATTAVSNILKPFPEFTGVTMQDMSNGGSYFHQLAVKVARRMSGGFLMSVDYSHSRLMDRVAYLNGGDLTLEKRVSTYDRPNNFAVSGLFQLPFGRGKRFAGTATGITNLLIGNWAISSGYTFHSGAPVVWGNVLYYGGDLHYDGRAVDHAFDTTRFNTVTAQQLSQYFRSLPSQFNNIRVDGTNNLNLTVMKDFALREKIKLQFRAESFNLCNHALFAAPNVTPTSAAFGVISSTTNTPRIIQSALRLTF